MRDELFKGQEDKKKQIVAMISKIDRNANKIFAKDLVASKEDSSLAALTGIT